MVMVEKSTGVWRMCMDFTHLNAACLKDNHPLPNINKMIDNGSGHKLLSSVDTHLGYNQIPLKKEDKEKVEFTSKFGTFCFRVISFGLKNVSTTF